MGTITPDQPEPAPRRRDDPANLIPIRRGRPGHPTAADVDAAIEEDSEIRPGAHRSPQAAAVRRVVGDLLAERDTAVRQAEAATTDLVTLAGRALPMLRFDCSPFFPAADYPDDRPDVVTAVYDQLAAELGAPLPAGPGGAR